MRKDGERAIIEVGGQARLYRRWCSFVAFGVFPFLLLSFFVVVLVLISTTFKRRDPEMQLVKATLDGMSSQTMFPTIQVQLNITLNLVLLIKNRNHVTFRLGPGKSILLYRGHQVGEANLPPSTVPAMKSTMVSSKLVLQMENMAADTGAIVSSVLAGKIVMASETVIPGRITVLKIFKKHVVATSECQFVVGIPSMKIQSRQCKYKTKL